MNRLILLFFFMFAVVFSSANFLLHRGSRPAAAGPAADAKSANDEDSLARRERGETSAPTPAGEPDEDAARDVQFANAREADESPNPPAVTPNPVKRSARKANQSKRVVGKRPPTMPTAPGTGGRGDPDLDRLQGTWHIVDTEYDGNRLAEEAQKYTWEFRLDKYTIKREGHFQELWAVQVDSGRQPKTITSTHDLSRQQLLGIYELTGDTLKVCFDLTGRGRPDSFRADKGSRRVCYYFQRAP